MFHLFRYFSIASLVSVIMTAAGIALLYRQVTTNAIILLSKQNNIVLAQTALNAVRDDLLDYLVSVRHLEQGQAPEPVLPANLRREIIDLTRGTAVAGISIYNQHGMVVFETGPEPGYNGLKRDEHRAPAAAMNGSIEAMLKYRDRFSLWNSASAEDNLVETYLPIRRGPRAPVEGVFEINTDISLLVREAEQAELIVMGGGLVILSLLYGTLLLIVRRARRIIETQQQTIHERTHTLEVLSAQMLSKEESEKQKLAANLHEGVAQTLSAIKYSLETTSGAAGPSPELLEQVVPAIQNAIQEVRSISTGLRPPNLDDFGILATLSWLCREFEAVYPGIRIHRAFELEESQVPAPLKIIIYRIVRAGLIRVAKFTRSIEVDLHLLLRDGSVTLVIDDRQILPAPATDDHLAVSGVGQDLGAGVVQSGDPERELATMEERAVLSGGLFSASRNESGGMTLQASWLR